jgi:hypothetical protein
LELLVRLSSYVYVDIPPLWVGSFSLTRFFLYKNSYSLVERSYEALLLAGLGWRREGMFGVWCGFKDVYNNTKTSERTCTDSDDSIDGVQEIDKLKLPIHVGSVT